MITTHLTQDSSMNALCNFLESLNTEIYFQHNELKKKDLEKLFVNLVEVLDDGKKHSSAFFKEFSEFNPIRTLDEEIDRLKNISIEISTRNLFYVQERN